MKTWIGKMSPEIIKKMYRLISYKNERRKFIREISIRKKQDRKLRQQFTPDATHLIIFCALGADWHTGTDEISGGILSIVSICEETAALKSVHHAETIMCTMNNAHLLVHHSKFENSTTVYRFSQLKKYFTKLSSVIIHIPEILTENFPATLTAADKKWLAKIPSVHINVMNQNIQLMPDPSVFGDLKRLAQKITITTAHTKYCSQHYRDYFGVPLHKLSVWISPEGYHFTKWADKENLLVVSPDKHPMKEQILQKLATVQGLTIQIIQNLTYTNYKKLVSRAKWSLTFGEGLDGYFIEPVFSGAIAFAVFNEAFFTADFKGLPGLFSSFEEMEASAGETIQQWDNETDFVHRQQEQFNLCARYYSKNQYRKNIAAFYNGAYTYA